ncbi:MAG: OmpA family protein [Pseudomonadales bacterium]|nr:OmpA family protein [Pseudomonadales bacterium]
MKFVKVSGTLGLAVLVTMAIPLARADDNGWYIGGNVGQSRARIDNTRITNGLLGSGFSTTAISNENRDAAFKLLGGYQFNPYVALEGGYYDLGRFGFNANTLPAGDLNGHIRVKGVNLDAVGFLPFTNKFSAFGRVGLNYADARDAFQGTGLVNVNDPNPSKSALNYKLGVGLQYAFVKSLDMRIEAERYRFNDAVGNRGDVDLLSVGLVYRFGQKTHHHVAETPEPVVTTPPVAAADVPSSPPTEVLSTETFSAASLFDFDQAIVKPDDKPSLDAFSASLKGKNYNLIEVTGHTDRIGSHDYNMTLSTQRAEAVKNYLIESTGIPTDKIVAKGVDGEDPVTKPDDCIGTKVTQELIDCLQPDRRVEVKASGTK